MIEKTKQRKYAKMRPRGRKGCKMLPEWLPKSKKIYMKIDTEKVWKKHWKNIQKSMC